MIKSIRLKNFKSFENQYFPFAPLTLLMGENAAGKSSLIQSILLLRQSSGTNSSQPFGLDLNGPLCSLGVGQDVLRGGSDDESIAISITTDVQTVDYVFSYLPAGDRLPLQSEFVQIPELTASGFAYLTAERVGPRLTNPRSIASATQRDLGIHGEGALAVLEQYRAEILSPDDARRQGRTGSLEELFQSYLSEISSNVRIDLQPYSGVDSIGSTFSFSSPGSLPGLPFRPTNVGFGLSYCLPIIVGCLVSQPGSLLIIENPEAHLHTRGQRAICNLLARTAMAGIQIIVETHSREIFYHLRKQAVAGAIDPSVGAVNYIEAVDGPDGQRSSIVSSLSTLDAALSDWPQNFFDAFGSPTDLVVPPA